MKIYIHGMITRLMIQKGMVVKLKSRISELLKIEYPIIQGGMAWVANAQLAANVSKAGGIGFI